MSASICDSWAGRPPTFALVSPTGGAEAVDACPLRLADLGFRPRFFPV